MYLNCKKKYKYLNEDRFLSDKTKAVFDLKYIWCTVKYVNYLSETSVEISACRTCARIMWRKLNVSREVRVVLQWQKMRPKNVIILSYWSTSLRQNGCKLANPSKPEQRVSDSNYPLMALKKQRPADLH